jgi:hypothetical protein
LKGKTMKILIWVVFGVLMALWTGFAAMSAGLVGWLLSAVADGQISGAAQAAGQWPIPAWLAVWVDPGMVENMQATWLSVVQTLDQWLPSASALTGWVVPLLVGGVGADQPVYAGRSRCRALVGGQKRRALSVPRDLRPCLAKKISASEWVRQGGGHPRSQRRQRSLACVGQ